MSSKFKNLIHFCDGDYSNLNEDRSSYGYNWYDFNSSLAVSGSQLNAYTAFQYKSAYNLNSLPYMGMYTTYPGGGYVYAMRGSVTDLIGNLSFLQSQNWIDRRTRAVFVEFTVYNPNINLFCVSLILVEFLPTGELITQAVMRPLNLFEDLNEMNLVKVICGVLYLCMVVIFMINEILRMRKMRRAYFKKFWNYIQWILIAFSWTAFAVYICRILATNEV